MLDMEAMMHKMFFSLITFQNYMLIRHPHRFEQIRKHFIFYMEHFYSFIMKDTLVRAITLPDQFTSDLTDV